MSEYRSRLIRIFEAYEPSKVNTVDDVLKQFQGKEDRAIAATLRKYNKPEPPDEGPKTKAAEGEKKEPPKQEVKKELGEEKKIEEAIKLEEEEKQEEMQQEQQPPPNSGEAVLSHMMGTSDKGTCTSEDGIFFSEPLLQRPVAPRTVIDPASYYAKARQDDDQVRQLGQWGEGRQAYHLRPSLDEETRRQHLAIYFGDRYSSLGERELFGNGASPTRNLTMNTTSRGTSYDDIYREEPDNPYAFVESVSSVNEMQRLANKCNTLLTLLKRAQSQSLELRDQLDFTREELNANRGSRLSAQRQNTSLTQSSPAQKITNTTPSPETRLVGDSVRATTQQALSPNDITRIEGNTATPLLYALHQQTNNSPQPRNASR